MTTDTALDLERAAECFHALSDPTRVAILAELRGGEQCVCDLVDTLGVAQSLLSFHLKTLKAAGFVSDRREGRWSYYTLLREALDEAELALRALRPARRSLRVQTTDCC
jgi:ArsR family transcriptional regulator, arsenate/arsenite/antimonite-responsive transcriptional repressor